MAPEEAGADGQIESRQRRLTLLTIWTALILFSSTGLAGEWATSLYGAVIGFIRPSVLESIPFVVVQKSYHVVLFAIFGWLLAPLFKPGRGHRFMICAFCCFSVGMLSEIVQFFFVERGPALLDVAINGLSGSLSSLIRIR